MITINLFPIRQARQREKGKQHLAIGVGVLSVIAAILVVFHGLQTGDNNVKRKTVNKLRTQLETLSWLFDSISAYFVIAILVVLQPELRRLFYQIGQARWYRTLIQVQQVPVDEIATAIKQMSDAKCGAIMAIVNKVGLKQYSESGVQISGRVSREFLVSIFYGKNPLHDGAVVIEGQNVTAAACYLPMSTSSEVKRSYGARHRAAALPHRLLGIGCFFS